MLLFINSVFHFLVDAVCISTLYSSELDLSSLLYGVVLYNTLAFSTQCIFGALFKDTSRLKVIEFFSIVLIGIASLFSFPFYLKIVFIGLGNSIFHVSAGALIICNNTEKARDVGIFVSTGALGVTLASCFAKFGTALAVAMLVLALFYLFFVQFNIRFSGEHCVDFFSQTSIYDIILLIFAVASRAFGGCVIRFSWKDSIIDSFILSIFIFAGKFCGGILLDHLNPKRTAIISLPLSAILIAFFPNSMLLSLVGQFLLNLTMPITLWLLFKKMPSKPALAFGLAASALWPGSIAGQLFSFSTSLVPLIVVLSLGVSFFAILKSSNTIDC